MAHYIATAFSPNMLLDTTSTVKMEKISDAAAGKWLRPDQFRDRCYLGHFEVDPRVRNCITDATLAQVLGLLLQLHVYADGERQPELVIGDVVLVAHYSGPELQVQTVTLPEGGRVDWTLVSVIG